MCAIVDDALGSPMMDQVSRWVRVGLALAMLAGGAWFTLVKPHAQDIVGNEVLQERINAIRASVSEIQAQRLDARMSVIEDILVEVKWAARFIASALLAQLLHKVKEQSTKRSEASHYRRRKSDLA